MTWKEWFDENRDLMMDAPNTETVSELTWRACEEATREACAEAVKEKIGHQWIEGHYDRFETVIINAEVK
jgi:hypothetical protein